MNDTQIELDRLCEVSAPADKLWDAQTHHSREHFGDLIPREMITADAILKEAPRRVCRSLWRDRLHDRQPDDIAPL